MRAVLPLPALLCAAAALPAQVQVWQEDFDDGVLDPAWTVSANPAMPWSCFEAAGVFRFVGLTAPVAAVGETYVLERPLPPQAGVFTFEAGIRWRDDSLAQGLPEGSQVRDLRIELLDAAGVPR